MSMRIGVFCGLLVFSSLAVADVPTPPPPAKYDVEIRYQIQAFRNERVRQYHEMLEYLKNIGFVRDPRDVVPEIEPEDIKATQLRGTIPSGKVGQLLQERHVRIVRLLPEGQKLPDAKDQPVRVHLQLHGGLSYSRQQVLAGQVGEVLQALGFRPAESFDHHDYLRMVGAMPAGQVELLLTDLRRLPTAWKMLPVTLLNDLRGVRGGREIVDSLLEDWFKDPAGRKLVREAVARWQGFPAAIEFMKTLPAAVLDNDDPTVFQEQMARNLAREPTSAEVLRKLFESVMADPAAQRLMDSLLPRLIQSPTPEVPLLFRLAAPVRLIEALPEMPLPALAGTPPAVPPGQEKISSDLRALMADPMEANKQRRLEVLLALTPSAEDRTWLRTVGSQDVVIEGRLGPVVTVVGNPALAPGLAALPGVVSVRLPRPAVTLPPPAGEWARDGAGRLPGMLARLQQLGARTPNQREPGSRVAIIATDFRGWENHKGKGLPASTRLLDMTRQRNYAMDPDGYVPDGVTEGAGTKHALALVRAVPTLELILVRIDPGSPHLLYEAILSLNGELNPSLTREQRHRELDLDRRLLDKRHDQLLEKRREVLLDFGQEDAAVKRREEYRKEQAQYDQDEQGYFERLGRFLQMERDLNDLKSVRAVWCTLVWPDGYAAGGSGPLTRYLDDRPFRALWLQPAGIGKGLTWTGLFRDVDSNGVMDFTPAEAPLPAGLWTRELAFLSWKGQAGETSTDLPAGALLRVSVQWREAHDPDLFRSGEDLYRTPLADLRLKVYYQPDPKGEKQPADDLELVAESSGLPQRLDKTANAAVWEHSLLIRAAKPGRYAIRLEGRAPDSIRPPSAPTVPAARRSGELHPRLYVRTLEGPGYAILRDYAIPAPAGMPADAQRVHTIPPEK
jgi:hypothetical protein